jgi:serine/threonine protein kinase
MIGRTVSHYRILSPLGSGGMGVVYLAEDERLGRQVALKFLPAVWSREREALDRFRVEARAASSLSHPGICAIYDIGEDGDTPYIVMEALRGETLRERIAKGPLKVSDVLDIGIQLSDALDAAHAQGIVHRDIKPANIFLGDKNRAKLLDFGLAKLTAASPVTSSRADTTSPVAHRAPENQITMPGVTVGTVSYMSPEQARGEDIDSRTDLFSLGAVLYEMATGHQPFGGSTTAVVYDAILNRAPRPVALLNALVPPRLEAVIATALEKDRELRCQHASDLEAELKRIRRDLDSASLTISQPGPAAAHESAPALARPAARSASTRPRRSWAVAAAGVAILTALTAGVWVLRGRNAVPDLAETPPAAESSALPPPVSAAVPGAALPTAAVSTPAPSQTAAPAGNARVVIRSEPPPQAARTVETGAEPRRSAPTPGLVAPATSSPTPPVIAAPATPVPVIPPVLQPPAIANNAGETLSIPSAAVPAPATATEPAAPISQPAQLSSPPPAPVESDENAIRRVLRAYEQAIETKDIALFRVVRPNLTAAEEAVLRNSFRQVDSQEIDIRVESLRVDGRTATARISRQDTLVTRGRRQTQNSTQTLRFEKTASGWVIAE